jgi:hypothetical protein
LEGFIVAKASAERIQVCLSVNKAIEHLLKLIEGKIEFVSQLTSKRCCGCKHAGEENQAPHLCHP